MKFYKLQFDKANSTNNAKSVLSGAPHLLKVKCIQNQSFNVHYTLKVKIYKKKQSFQDHNTIPI